jgi:hypothetical protein
MHLVVTYLEQHPGSHKDSEKDDYYDKVWCHCACGGVGLKLYELFGWLWQKYSDRDSSPEK